MKLDLNKILSYTKKTDTDCLEWTRCYNTDGYPRAVFNGNLNGKVHRIVWELYNKQSASNKIIRHTCDNPRCINPTHLLLGSSIDNIQDRTNRDRTYGLKQKDVIAIKSLYKTVYSAKELSQIYNVSLSTIYYTLLHRKVGT